MGVRKKVCSDLQGGMNAIAAERPEAGRRADPVGAQFSTMVTNPEVSLYQIAICIYVIILIGLRQDTYKSSRDVVTKPFSG